MEKILGAEQAKWVDSFSQKMLRASAAETWSGHWDTRFPELCTFAELFPAHKQKLMVEIGCGNALGSAFFSNRFEKIIATDLAQEDHQKHAIGFDKAKKLLAHLEIKNIELVGCSAEQLPFSDATVDVIFGMYCLEHIPDQSKALQECLRVLRKNGELIVSVPAAAWSVFFPLFFYYEIFFRVIHRLGRKIFSRKVVVSNSQALLEGEPEVQVVVKDWKSFHKAYPHFPIPEPHGVYKSYFHEFISYRPSAWRNLLDKEGFQSIELHAVSIIPRGLFIVFLGNKWGNAVFEKLLPLDHLLCRQACLMSFAQFLSIRARKN